MINQLSDIVLGREYCFYMTKDRRMKRRAIVHALINEKEEFPDVGRTEAYLSVLGSRGRVNEHLLFVSEFGIGETYSEAFLNFGRFKHEENPSFEPSARLVQERMLKVPITRFRS